MGGPKLLKSNSTHPDRRENNPEQSTCFRIPTDIQFLARREPLVQLDSWIHLARGVSPCVAGEGRTSARRHKRRSAGSGAPPGGPSSHPRDRTDLVSFTTASVGAQHARFLAPANIQLSRGAFLGVIQLHSPSVASTIITVLLVSVSIASLTDSPPAPVSANANIHSEVHQATGFAPKLGFVGSSGPFPATFPCGVELSFGVTATNASSGLPLENVTITVRTSLGDSIVNSATENTSVSGIANFSFYTPNFPTPTTDEVIATGNFLGSTVVATENVTVSVEPHVYGFFFLRDDSSIHPIVLSGQVMELAAVVYYNGSIVNNVLVQIADSRGEILGQGVTTVSPEFRLILNVTAPSVSTVSTLVFTATASEFGQIIAQASIVIQVQPSPPPTLFDALLGSLGTVIGLALSVLLFLVTIPLAQATRPGRLSYLVSPAGRARLSATTEHRGSFVGRVLLWNSGSLPLTRDGTIPPGEIAITAQAGVKIASLERVDAVPTIHNFQPILVAPTNHALVKFQWWEPDAGVIAGIEASNPEDLSAIGVRGWSLPTGVAGRCRDLGRFGSVIVWRLPLFAFALMAWYLVGWVFPSVPAASTPALEVVAGLLVAGVASIWLTFALWRLLPAVPLSLRRALYGEDDSEGGPT
jgi:hypothetical protein